MSESTTPTTPAQPAASTPAQPASTTPAQPAATAPVQGGPALMLIVAAFGSEQTAEEAKKQIEQAGKTLGVQIQDIAVIRCDANRKVHIKETKDMGGGKGAVAGGVVGGLLGLLAGPVGWAVVGGAVIGGVAAKVRDGGFKDENLRKLGASLQPNSSAVVALIGNQSTKQVRQIMEQSGGQVNVAPISADIAKALSEGKDVAYTLGATSEGVSASRMAANADTMEYDAVVATEDAVYVETATANKDGFVAGAGVVTSEGAAAVIVEGKVDKSAKPAADKAPAEGEAAKTDAAPATDETKKS